MGDITNIEATPIPKPTEKVGKQGHSLKHIPSEQRINHPPVSENPNVGFILDRIMTSGEDLESRKDFLNVIVNLTRGEIVEKAKALGYYISDPGPSMEYSLGTYVDLKNEEDFRTILRSLAQTSHCIIDPQSRDKHLDLAYVNSLIDPDFFINPVNQFDTTIRYDINDVHRLAKENCLMLMEEWCHLLQNERNGPISKKLTVETKYDPEVDVALFLQEIGINLSGTAFIKRYNRQAVMNNTFYKKRTNEDA